MDIIAFFSHGFPNGRKHMVGRTLVSDLKQEPE
jgi:hypothetical protein